MKRTLNAKLLLGLLAAVVGFGSGVHFLHAYQVQRNAGILLKQAARFEEQGDVIRAAAYLGRYLAYAPQDIEALVKYAALLEKFPESARTKTRTAFVMEKVLRHDPRRNDVRRKLVRVEMELGRFADARDHLDLLLKNACKGDGELEALRGRCQESAGEFARAAHTYKQSIRHAPERVQTYVDLARLLRQRLDRPAQADGVMDGLVKANPRTAAAFLARGRYRLAFDQKGADDDIHQARQLAPDDAEVYLASAEVLRREKQSKQAQELLEKGLAKHPGDARLYRELALLQMDANRLDEAIACLRRGLEAVPDQPSLMWALAERLIEAEHHAEASDLLARMGRAGFAPARLDYLQARLLMNKRQWPEAVRLLNRSRPQLASAPDLLKQVELRLARCHGALGDNEQTEAAYRRAIALDSRWLAPRLALAAALAKLGKVDEAVIQYQHAMALPGAPASAWIVLARTRLEQTLRRTPRQQDWKTVERDLERAAEQSPGSPEVPVLRARMLMAQGQHDQARSVLEQARNRRPEQVELWAALVDLTRSRAQYGQAQAILRHAEQRLGDTPAMRLLAMDYWSGRPAAESRPALAKLAAGLEKFSTADQDRLRMGLAAAYQRAGLFTEARRQWDDLARRKPDDLRVRLAIFDLALKAGDETGLAKTLAEIERVEGNDGALGRLGQAAWKLVAARRGETRALAEAKSLLTEAAARRPGWPRVALLEAEVAELEKHNDRALEKYQRALELGERQLPVVRRVVQLLYERHRYADAEQVLRRLQGPGELTGDLGRMAAELSLYARNPVRALELAQQAVLPASRDYRDHIWLGQVRAAAGQAKEAEESFRRALELGEKEPAAWMALVHYLAQRQQPEQAEKLLRQAKAKLPANQASLTLAFGYETLGNRKEAEANYRAVLKERPEDVMALAQISRFYLAVGRPADAQPHLRKMLDPKVKAGDTDQAFARRGLAICLANQGDFPRFKEALALLQTNAKKPIHPDEDQRALAQVLAMRPSRRREAIGLLEKLKGRQRLTPGDRFLLARLYAAGRDWTKARAQMLDLLATEGGNPTYLAYYADALLRHGDRAEVAVWLEKLEKVQPRAFRTVSLRARFLKARGNTDGAVRAITAYAAGDGADLARAAVLLEDLGQAPAAEPLYRQYAAAAKVPEAALTLALYLARRRNVVEALALCEKAWDTCSPERVAAVSVDVLQIGRASDQQARQVEEKIQAVAKERGESPIFDLALGQLYYQRQRYAEAEPRYRAALRQEPDNLIGLNNLAWLLTLRARKPAEALKLVDRAIAKTGAVEDLYERPVNSSVPNLLDTRAVTYLALGRIETALKDLEPAVAVTPSRIGYHHLALAYRMAHHAKAAEKALQQAAKLGFKDDQIDPLERKAVEQMINTTR